MKSDLIYVGESYIWNYLIVFGQFMLVSPPKLKWCLGMIVCSPDACKYIIFTSIMHTQYTDIFVTYLDHSLCIYEYVWYKMSFRLWFTGIGSLLQNPKAGLLWLSRFPSSKAMETDACFRFLRLVRKPESCREAEKMSAKSWLEGQLNIVVDICL